MEYTEQEIKEIIHRNREFIKRHAEDREYVTDQMAKKPQPPLCKDPMTTNIMDLPHNFEDLDIDNDFLHVINSRCSSRIYSQQNMSLLELSYLLWCTQGIKSIRGVKYATIRTVPCGGARHEFETYMLIKNVDGLQPGLYHYLPMKHQLECLKVVEEGIDEMMDAMTDRQSWAVKSNVLFFWTMVPYRAEWRYGINAAAVAIMDIGYVSENMYLACTSIGLGTCALGAIDGDYMNPIFGIDGEEEFFVLCNTVGTIDQNTKKEEDSIYAFVKEQGL